MTTEYLLFLTFCILFEFSVTKNLFNLEVYTERRDLLYLTPLIENGRLKEGRKLAEVTELGWNVKSYSGLLTVQKEYESNMFFWYFPAERRPNRSPFLIWLNGYSTSSTYGIFLQNGPYSINGNVLVPRNTSWQKYYNIVYIDNPVGVGFSFTNSANGYSKNLDHLADNLHNALTQFLKLFPELSSRELYLTGLSLGGKYISSLAYRIYQLKFFNLKGIFLGNPILDPFTQTHYRNYLYELGFIDNKEGEKLEQIERIILNYLTKKQYQEFYEVYNKFLLNDDNYIVNVTGLQSIYNYESPYINTDDYTTYINRADVKKAIHVGNLDFNNGSYAMSYLREVYAYSVKGWMEKMLDRIKVMIYVGQLDIVCAYPMLVQTLTSLNWSGKAGYANAKRLNLYEANSSDVWGYLKNYGPLTDVLVRKADHSAVSSQPKHVLELLFKFTN